MYDVAPLHNDAPVQDFNSVKERLDEIVEAVSTENIELEQALDLYEEAIKLGMKASSLLEEDIVGKADEGDISAFEQEALTAGKENPQNADTLPDEVSDKS